MLDKSKRLIIIGSVMATTAIATSIAVPILLLNSKKEEEIIDYDVIDEIINSFLEEIGVQNPLTPIPVSNEGKISSRKVVESINELSRSNNIISIFEKIGFEASVSDDNLKYINETSASVNEEDSLKINLDIKFLLTTKATNIEKTITLKFGDYLHDDLYMINQMSNLITNIYNSNGKESTYPSTVADGSVSYEKLGLDSSIFDFSNQGISTSMIKKSHDDEKAIIIIDLELNKGEFNKIIENIEIRGFKSSLGSEQIINMVKKDYQDILLKSSGFDSELEDSELDILLNKELEIGELDCLQIKNFPTDEIEKVNNHSVSVFYNLVVDATQHLEGKTYYIECGFSYDGITKFFLIKLNSSNLVMHGNQDKVDEEKIRIEAARFDGPENFLDIQKYLSDSRFELTQNQLWELGLNFINIYGEFSYKFELTSEWDKTSNKSKFILSIIIIKEYAKAQIAYKELFFIQGKIDKAIDQIKKILDNIGYQKVKSSVIDEVDTTKGIFEKFTVEIMRKLKLSNIPFYPKLNYEYTLVQEKSNIESGEITYDFILKGKFENAPISGIQVFDYKIISLPYGTGEQ